MDSSINFIIPLVLVAILAVAGVLFIKWKKLPPEAPKIKETEKSVAVPAPKPTLEERLGKTRGGLSQKLSQYFSKGATFTSAEWDTIEEILLESDVGIQTATVLLERVKNNKTMEGGLKELIKKESIALFGNYKHGEQALIDLPKPFVISIVGINGVGKTTTIGKLAQKFKSQGKSVLLGAADTFRAGAIQQLKIWSERVGTDFVTGREGADPGAVAFDSVTAAKARGTDIVLLDTAGRLHTKSNLMDELAKIHRVIKKVIPEAPHETWLVVDGSLGQNSVNQAREFKKTLDLTGVIVTKLDGTAKGGAVLSIVSELGLPLKYIGIGESVDDLVSFEPEAFINAILG